MTKDSFLKDNEQRFNFILLILFIGVSLIFTITHECWRDDAQAWLIVRDLSIKGIFEELPFEGHPAVWYFILFPFVKIGLPFQFIKVISFTFSVLTAILVIYKSPFNKMMRFVIMFSPFMIYYYPAFGRPYSLIIFLIFLLAYFYQYRKEKAILYNVLILILFNTHVLFSVFCSGLLVLQFIEIIADLRKKEKVSKFRWIGLMIGFFGGLLLVAQLYNTFDMNADVGTKKDNYEDMAYYLKPFFKKITETMQLAFYWTDNWNILFVYAHVVVILIITYTLAMIKYPKQMFAYICGTYFITIFSVFLYTLDSETKFFLSYVLMIYACWAMYYEKPLVFKRKKPEKKDKKDFEFNPIIFLNVVIFTLIILASPQNYKLMIRDIKYEYTYSKDTADFIKENIPKGSNFICATQMISGICAYLDKEDYTFYDPFTGKSRTFLHLSDDGVYSWAYYKNLESRYMLQKSIEKNPNFYDNIRNINEKTDEEMNAAEIAVFDFFQNFAAFNFEKGEKIYLIAFESNEEFYDDDDKSKCYRKKIYDSNDTVKLSDENYVIYEMTVE